MINMMKTNFKEKFIEQIKNLSLFSHWKFLLFLLFSVALLIILFVKFDFKLLFNSFGILGFVGIGIIFLISVFEQFLYFIRFKLFFRKKSTIKDFIYYIPTNFSSQIIPPPPLGYYARFLLTKYFYKTSIKKSIFLVAIDSFLEAIIILLFALFGLLFFPKTDLGLGALLISLVIIGVLYYIFNYYETKQDIIKSKILQRIIVYFSNIKQKFLKGLFNDIKKNKFAILIAFFVSILKFVVNIIKIYFILFLGYPIDVIAVAALTSIYLFITATSSVPGGLGVAELSFVLLAKSLGVNADIALVIVLLERFFTVWLWALIGLFIGIYEKSKITQMHKKFLMFLSSVVVNLKNNKLFVKK